MKERKRSSLRKGKIPFSLRFLGKYTKELIMSSHKGKRKPIGNFVSYFGKKGERKTKKGRTINITTKAISFGLNLDSIDKNLFPFLLSRVRPKIIPKTTISNPVPVINVVEMIGDIIKVI